MRYLPLFIIFSISAQAETITLNQKEFNSMTTLSQIEKNHIHMDGKQGVWEPANFLKAFGMTPQIFDIPEFMGKTQVNDVNSQKIQLKLMESWLEFRIEFEEQDPEFVSKTVRARFEIDQPILHLEAILDNSNGVELIPTKAEFLGQVSILGRAGRLGQVVQNILTREINKALKKEMGKAVNRPEINDSLNEMLLFWAKLQTGKDWKMIQPRSLKIQNYKIEYEVAD